VSASFTIVPTTPFAEVVGDVLAAAREKSDTILIVAGAPGTEVKLYFAGDLEVRCHAQPDGLMCVRLVPDTGVIHVDSEGYEGGLADLEEFLRWAIDRFGPCRLLDDETGEDRSGREASVLLEPEPEFEEPSETL
jgi:hypothetical protein